VRAVGAARHETITLATRLKPFRTAYNRLLFVGARLVPRLVGIHRLGTVHTTRWTLLTRIPYNGRPQVRARPAAPVLLWESDYTGLTQPYIAAFVQVLGPQIDRLWRPTSPRPPATAPTPTRPAPTRRSGW
jgi:hypothetical protein